MKFFMALFALLSCVVILPAQTLMTENFDYPVETGLQSHGWLNFNNSIGADVLVANPGLSYPNYPNSGIGNTAHITGDEQEVRNIFSPAITSGTFYISFMVEVNDAVDVPTSFRYVLALGENGSTALWGRFWVLKNTQDQVAFGIEYLNADEDFTTNVYSLSTTYLIVIKYTFVDEGDDMATLFVFEDGVPGSEPGTPTAGPVFRGEGENEPDQIDQVLLLQRAAENDIFIDGIRVGLSWDDGAPLPVELSSFTHSVSNNNVELRWTTVSETDNFGFEVHRKSSDSAWHTLGFVPGRGTTNDPHIYVYLDEDLSPGEYHYRLKQVDTNGDFSLSPTLAASVLVPENMSLGENYPNPFNPRTQFNYSLTHAGHVSIEIYDMKGRLIQRLTDEDKSAGRYTATWNGRSLNGTLAASGTYLYVLKVDGQQMDSRKMTLVK